MGIFVVLMLFDVLNFISQIQGYQEENKIRVTKSYKYRHHCARHNITRLQIQQNNHSALIRYIIRKLDNFILFEVDCLIGWALYVRILKLTIES